MPAGRYVASYEDENGYYYTAPHKIPVRDTFFSSLNDGGLFLKKGLKKPDHIFILTNEGVPTRIGIGDRAKVRMIE